MTDDRVLSAGAGYGCGCSVGFLVGACFAVLMIFFIIAWIFAANWGP